MAPLPIILGTSRVAFHWRSTKFPRDAVNVMHFQADPANSAALFAAIAANVGTSMWAHTESVSKITRLVVTPLDGSSASVEFITDGTAKWNGAGSPADVIQQACALVKLTTSFRGRSFRGRVYLPWVSEGVQTDGKLASATVTNMNTAWTSFITGMSAAGSAQQVASYKLAQAHVVAGHLIETPLATQRLRQDR